MKIHARGIRRLIARQRRIRSEPANLHAWSCHESIVASALVARLHSHHECGLAVALVLASTATAHAEDDCRSVDIRFVPSQDLQLVAWIEDASGHYVDTAFYHADHRATRPRQSHPA